MTLGKKFDELNPIVDLNGKLGVAQNTPPGYEGYKFTYSSDVTMAADSDAIIPTQRAVKAYAGECSSCSQQFEQITYNAKDYLYPKESSLGLRSIFSSFNEINMYDDGLLKNSLNTDGSDNLITNPLKVIDGLKDFHVSTAVHVGDSLNTSEITPNKTLIGGINSCYSSFFNYSPYMFFLDENSLIPENTQNTNAVFTITNLRSVTSENIRSFTVNNSSKFMAAFYFDNKYKRSVIDTGRWSYEVWSNVDSAVNEDAKTYLIFNLMKISGTSITGTITGSGTSRTLTTTAPLFSSSDYDADQTLTSYIQTPNALLKIIGYTGTQTVTVETLSTYTNESSVVVRKWSVLSRSETQNIVDTTLNRIIVTNNADIEHSLSTNETIGIIGFAKTTAAVNCSVSVAFGGVQHKLVVCTPIYPIESIARSSLSNANYNSYRVDALATSGTTTLSLPHIPKQVKQIKSVVIRAFISSGAAGPNKNIDFSTMYCDGIGGVYNQFSSSDVTTLYDFTGKTDRIAEIDITRLFPNLKADYEGTITVTTNLIGGTIYLLDTVVSYIV